MVLPNPSYPKLEKFTIPSKQYPYSRAYHTLAIFRAALTFSVAPWAVAAAALAAVAAFAVVSLRKDVEPLLVHIVVFVLDEFKAVIVRHCRGSFSG